MPWTMLLTTVRAEIAAVQDRADMQSSEIQALLAAGQDSTDAVQALFRELDSLTLLRKRLHSVEALQDWPEAA